MAECAAFSVPNEMGIDTLWAAVVADAGTDDGKLRAHCGAHMPSQFIPMGLSVLTRCHATTWVKSIAASYLSS